MKSVLVASIYLSIFALTLLVAAADDDAKKNQDICGSDSYCVTLYDETGGRMVIDELDRDASTVTDLEKRIPGWFGPRPATFHYETITPDPTTKRVVSINLEAGKTFASYDMKHGAKVIMKKKAVDTKSGDL